MSEKHLLLIDGSNILRTCYEANPTEESLAKAEGAIKSAVGSIMKGVRRHNPTHVFIAFDVPNQKTWRHEVYAGYKKSRKPTPAVLVDVIPLVKAQLAERGLFVAQAEGYEAEDLLARVGRVWAGKTTEPVTVLSTDKDLTLLVSEGILVHAHFNDVWRDSVWIQDTYGVSPEMLLTYFSLVGDSVDDIPGMAGVGQKTAAKLVNEYGALEDIFAAAKDGRITAKGLLKNVLAGEESALLSRELLSFRAPDEMNLTFSMLKFG